MALELSLHCTKLTIEDTSGRLKKRDQRFTQDTNNEIPELQSLQNDSKNSQDEKRSPLQEPTGEVLPGNGSRISQEAE